MKVVGGPLMISGHLVRLPQWLVLLRAQSVPPMEGADDDLGVGNKQKLG